MAELKVLYHGNCLDGVISAAVFSRFYRDSQDPDARISFRGMAHGKDDPFGEDHDATFDAEVNAVVDFRYSPSPRLNWWCDHHHTAFLAPAHQRHFEQDQTGRKRFDSKAPSCAGLLVRWLGEAYGFEHPLFEDHASWADLVDSAAFTSPAQAVELAEPALQLMVLLEAAPGPELTDHLIEGLGRRSIAQVHDQPRVRQALAPVLEAHRGHTDIFRAQLEVSHRVATFDLTEEGVEGFNKFIPYHLISDLDYTVGLTLSARRAKVSVGSNPWSRPEPLVNLGELCQRYGGGGHPVVGAVTLAPNQLREARRAFEEISEILRVQGTLKTKMDSPA